MSTYTPYLFSPDRLTLQPKIAEINELSQWQLKLSLPFPVDQYCWVQLFFPRDLSYDRQKLDGRGMFQPN